MVNNWTGCFEHWLKDIKDWGCLSGPWVLEDSVVVLNKTYLSAIFCLSMKTYIHKNYLHINKYGTNISF